jgi:hypothetical protein
VISSGALIYLNNFNSRQKLDKNKDEIIYALKLAQSYAKTRQAPLGYVGDLQYVEVSINGSNLIAGVNGLGTTYFSNLVDSNETTVTLNPVLIYFWAGGKLSHSNLEGNLYGVGESAGVNVKSNSEDGGTYQIGIDAMGQIDGGKYIK